jgi:hypothetical protein
VDALALTGEEGRATCEKPRGTGRSEDPRISEWGNLVKVMLHYLHLNK